MTHLFTRRTSIHRPGLERARLPRPSRVRLASVSRRSSVARDRFRRRARSEIRRAIRSSTRPRSARAGRTTRDRSIGPVRRVRGNESDVDGDDDDDDARRSVGVEFLRLRPKRAEAFRASARASTALFWMY